jgi:hypothetical protein
MTPPARRPLRRPPDDAPVAEVTIKRYRGTNGYVYEWELGTSHGVVCRTSASRAAAWQDMEPFAWRQGHRLPEET